MTDRTRRAALLTLAGGAVAAPAALLAVRTASAQTAPITPSPASQADYVMRTLAAGGWALRASRIAQSKSQNLMVREFAELEIGEQTAIATVLSATRALPPAMTVDQLSTLQTLQDMPAGTDFDLAYVEGQITGHEELLTIQKTLSSETVATVEAITARLAEQAIATHLAMLGHIRAIVMTSSTGPAALEPAPATPADTTAPAPTPTTPPAPIDTGAPPAPTAAPAPVPTNPVTPDLTLTPAPTTP